MHALIPPDVAVTVLEPTVSVESEPLESILAIDGFDEVHATVVVMSRLIPLLNWPLTENCCAFPNASDALCGEMVRDVRTVFSAVEAPLALPFRHPIKAQTGTIVASANKTSFSVLWAPTSFSAVL
jgi:hypothetical protein